MYSVAAAIFTLALLRAKFVQAQVSAYSQIASSISSASTVYYPPEPQYEAAIHHYATSSTLNSSCAVEPGTAEDVGIILQILGESSTPFAVKGGGHIMNPQFSSTTGMQIAMSRFNTVEYDASTQTVVVGAGLVWDDVYAVLEDFDVNVVGGRVSGIGVAGYTLGGGYSWLTNQYGLTLDTVQAFELVLPNGTVMDVTDSSNPELFYGLKGGYNNFGVVTAFTLRTFPQGQVWGGQITYLEASVDALSVATAEFYATVTDPKAAIITTYDYVEGMVVGSVLMFYDAPTVPPGIFDQFLSIPSIASNVSTRSFLSLVQVTPATEAVTFRGYYNTVPLMDITPGMLDAVLAQTEYWGSELGSDSAVVISYDVEPFLPDILTHGSPSAYPWTRAERFLPLNIFFSWTSSLEDTVFYNAIVQTALTLTIAAMEEGQYEISGAPPYPNYAIYSTPMSDIYGPALSTLTELKQMYDPNDVMGLAGGWKVRPSGVISAPDVT